LENSLDQFKITLGLPTDIPVRLDDSLLTQFQLADPDLEKLQKDLKLFFADYRELPEAPSLAKLREGFEKLKDFRASILKLIEVAEVEIDRWRKQPPASGEGEDEIKRQRASQDALQKQVPELRDDLRTLAKDIDKAVADLAEDKRKDGW